MHICFAFFNMKLIINKRGMPEAPPSSILSILNQKENAKYEQIYKKIKEGGQMFQKIPGKST